MDANLKPVYSDEIKDLVNGGKPKKAIFKRIKKKLRDYKTKVLNTVKQNPSK